MDHLNSLPSLNKKPSKDSLACTMTQGRREFIRIQNQASGAVSDTWGETDGGLPKPLDKKYADVKKHLIAPENYAARAEEIAAVGSDYIPTIDFSCIDPTNGTFPQKEADLIKSRGCCIIRGVVSPEKALEWKDRMYGYVKKHPNVAGVPLPKQDPQIWKVYWSPAQVEARSNPSVIAAQIAMSKLYSASDDSEVDLASQAICADRFRVRYPGTVGGLPPHLDNGGIECWEDHEYSLTYRAILEGRWEEYDVWNMDHRDQAQIDMYGGPGSCSVFRSLQAWLSLADNAPGNGTLQLVPDIKLSTAYVILRPFFDTAGKLDISSTYFYGADPGMGQVVKDSWHPGLHMSKTIISVPKAGPGDYVFWHCDVVHTVEQGHFGTSDSSVAYMAVVPLTSYNIENMVMQRKAFLDGVPPPDMISKDGEEVEKYRDDRGIPSHIVSLEGKRMIGFERFNTEESGLTIGQVRVRAWDGE